MPCLYPRRLMRRLNGWLSMGCSLANLQYIVYAWYTSVLSSLWPSAFFRQSEANRLMWSLCVRHMSRMSSIVMLCVSLPPLSITRRRDSSSMFSMPLFSRSVVSSRFRFGLSPAPSNWTGKWMMMNRRNTASLSSAMSGRRLHENTSFALFFRTNMGCPLYSAIMGSPVTSDFMTPRLVISLADMSA